MEKKEKSVPLSEHLERPTAFNESSSSKSQQWIEAGSTVKAAKAACSSGFSLMVCGLPSATLQKGLRKRVPQSPLPKLIWQTYPSTLGCFRERWGHLKKKVRWAVDELKPIPVEKVDYYKIEKFF